MIKEIFNYINKNKFSYIILTICILIEYAIVLVPTIIIQKTIDAIASESLTFVILRNNLSFLFICMIIGYLAGFYWIYKLYALSHNFLYELRLRMFNKFLTMRKSYYDKFTTGDMITRFTNDGRDFQSIVGYGAMNLLFALAYMVFVVPAMFAISIKISVMASIPILAGGFLIYHIGIKYDLLVEKEREAISSLSNEVLEIVEGIRVIRAFSESESYFKVFNDKTNELKKKNNTLALYTAVFSKFPNILSGLSTAIVVYFGAFTLFNNEITLGQLVALQLYSLLLLWPMWILTDFFAVYKTSKVSYNRINELLKTDDDFDIDGDKILKNIEKIEFRDYSFKYKYSLPESLRKINLVINKGETIGVIGKTGSGKTSLIRQLLLQYPQGEGEILINDIPLSNYKRESVEKLISYVPQEHFLFSNDILSNIKVGKAAASEKEIENAIKAAAFDSDIENLNAGLNTMVGEKGVSISGGQKQRILLARAFLKNADLLVLDDALSAVDTKTEREIIGSIVKLRNDKTNIIVTHRLSAVLNADKIIVMDNGNIVETGTPKELYDAKGWYYEQVIRQDLEEKEGE